ncbi:MAG TPA: ABC transporter permease [Caulobacteraceae bacterium]|nr:ABC transporter permease [Caulobacteraceae bacterium]
MNFSLRRCLAIARVETLGLFADRGALALIFVLPVVQILLYGYAISLQPRHVPVAIAASEPRLVQPMLPALRGNASVDLIGGLGPTGSAERAVRQGRAMVGVEVGRDPATRAVSVRFVADAGDPAEVRPVVAALNVGVWRRAAQLYAEDQAPTVETQWLYDPGGGGASAWDVSPGLIGAVVMVTMLFTGSITLVRERERGSWESLLATPVRPAEALVGKLAPYLVIGVTQTLGLLAIVHVLFGVPLPSAAWALIAATPVYVAAYLALGFAVSTLAQTQLQAVQASAFAYLPSMLLSGFMFPFDGMPDWARMVGEAIPLTHYIRATRDILLRGLSPAAVWSHLWPIALFTAVAFGLAVVSYRRRLD